MTFGNVKKSLVTDEHGVCVVTSEFLVKGDSCPLMNLSILKSVYGNKLNVYSSRSGRLRVDGSLNVQQYINLRA